MVSKSIYFIFTDTGTLLSKAINCCTRRTLNHVSIAMDDDLKEVYSFGRKVPGNPFIGGFVREDINSGLLRNSKAEIYEVVVSETSYNNIYDNIKKIEKREEELKYNFIGLFYVLFNIKKERENHFFCSEFVSYVINDCKEFNLPKDTLLMRPYDLRKMNNMNLVYKGRLCEIGLDYIGIDSNFITM